MILLLGYQTNVPLNHSPLHLIIRHYSKEAQYEVNGVLVSRTDVKNMPFAERSVTHWRLLVDWDLQVQRPFVVIDPFDPQGLLYLTSHEYTVHTRTLARAGISVTVIARPGTEKPVPSKQPPQFLSDCLDAIFGDHTEKSVYTKGSYRHKKWLEESDLASDFSRVPWSEFTDLRKFISRNILWGEGQTVRITHENVMPILMLWSRELLHYLDFKSPGSRIGQLMPFIRHLQILLKHNGPAFVIQRLKISLFCVYSYVGGNPVTSTEELGQRVRLSNGIPTFIDRRLRASLRDGTPSSIRLWASLLNIYKALNGPHGEPPLETIQAPPFKGDVGDFASFCQGLDNFYDRLESTCRNELPGWKYKTSMGYLISSAGANSKCAMTSLRFDLLAWEDAVRHLPREWFQHWGDQNMLRLIQLLGPEAKRWYRDREVLLNTPYPPPLRPGEKKGTTVLHGKYHSLTRRADIMDEEGELEPWRMSIQQVQEFREMIWDCYKNGKPGSPSYERAKRFLSTDAKDKIPGIRIEEWVERFRGNGLHPIKHVYHTPIVGRLHAIPEPAGKVRVVAIGDYFSQVALKPLHEYLFSLLRLIPTDATFGQQEAVDAFAAKGYKDIFSFDLKAATDLIPSQLYTEVLEPLIGRKGADLWHSLMKDRKWLSPREVRKNKGPEFVNYTRGQPMGLLSSWASLALVHHALVQYAAMRVGLKGWFMAYLVLGDDVVIACKLVADEYLRVCDEFGITVGRAKSLVSSKGLLNFASQTFLGNVNLSPISFGEELVALSWSRRKELAHRICHRYVGKDYNESAYLRRVLTANQWASLQGELTGLVKGNKSRFIEFILRNPFVSKTNELHIGHVLDWLGKLIPSLTGANSLRDEIGKALQISLLYLSRTSTKRDVKTGRHAFQPLNV